MNRRDLLAGAIALASGPALAQGNVHGHRAGQFERLNQPGRADLPCLHHADAVTESPAPRAAQQRAWRSLGPPPVPRTETTWAVEYRGRMHPVCGHAEQRVDRPYHHAHDPATSRWEAHAPMRTPRHGMGALVIADSVYVAGGGPQMGSGVKSAINGAITLAA